jgi:hypothetical protein
MEVPRICNLTHRSENAVLKTMMRVALFVDRGCVATTAVLWALLASRAAGADHQLVMLKVQVTLDRVSQERSEAAHTKVGQVDRLRIVYDPATVDPATHRVVLLNFQHLVDGHYEPATPDPVAMPMTDAWLDLSTKPYRMHLKAAVVHGSPILIEVDEVTRRLTIHPQNDLHSVLISGPYQIDPTPIRTVTATSNP